MKVRLALVAALCLATRVQADDRACLSAEVLKKLDDRTAAVRYSAAQAVADCGDSRAEPVLIEALAARGGQDRNGLVRRLGRIGGARSIQPLLEIVAENGLEQEVIDALTQIDPGWRKRPEAQRAGMQIKAALLRDEEQSHEAASPDASDGCCRRRRDRLEALALLDPPAAAEVAGQLLEDRQAEWCGASALLGILVSENVQGAAEPLVRRLGNLTQPVGETDEIARALFALAPDWRESPVAIDVGKDLLARLEDPNQEDRVAIARALRYFRVPEGLPVLARVLADRAVPEYDRSEVAAALQEYEDPRALDALVRCVETAPRTVRESCIYGLGQTGGEQRVPLLLRFLRQSQPDDNTRTALMHALLTNLCIDPLMEYGDQGQDCGGERRWAPSLPASTADLASLLSDRSAFVRKGAAMALSQLRLTEALPALWGAMDAVRQDSGEREAKREIMSALLAVGGEAELERLLDVTREDPELATDLTLALLDQKAAPIPALLEMVAGLSQSRQELSPRPGNPASSSATMVDEIDTAFERAADRLASEPTAAAETFLRWLARHDDPRIRAKAHYALFRAGLRPEPTANRTPAQ